jgi:hypothetical protein
LSGHGAQVCGEITPQNEARELKGLLEALTAWKIKDGLILTAKQESERVVERHAVRIQPVLK